MGRKPNRTITCHQMALSVMWVAIALAFVGGFLMGWSVRGGAG